jgi:hypothetical protein
VQRLRHDVKARKAYVLHNEGSRLRAKIIVVCLNSWLARWEGAAFDAPSPKRSFGLGAAFRPRIGPCTYCPQSVAPACNEHPDLPSRSGDWQFGPNYLAAGTALTMPHNNTRRRSAGPIFRCENARTKTNRCRRTGTSREVRRQDRWRRPRARNGCRAMGRRAARGRSRIHSKRPRRAGRNARCCSTR